MATAKPLKIPKNLAQCADLLYTTRNSRLELQKQVDALQAEETALREHLINNLPKSQASGIAGKMARATIEMKQVVKVADWNKLYDYIIKNAKKNPGVWSLLQKRVGDTAVKEMWEAKYKVPGVEALDVPFVSLNKL